MTPTRFLISQILLILAVATLAVWMATQWAAAMLGYQQALGRPWVLLFHLRLYRPWSIFLWWYWYDAYAPRVFSRAGMLAGASGFLGCAVAITASIWRARQTHLVTTYGSARWATDREIDQLGLTRADGVFLGTFEHHFLRHDGPEHVMAFAPTRSGKGVGLVIPTLLTWPHSAIVHDIKGENWRVTSGWRTRISHCLLFDPTDLQSARYNPLLEVRRGPHEVRDVQNIADILVDPVITTDRRSYHISLSSTVATAMSAVSWTYPQDALIVLKHAKDATEASAPIAAALSVDQLEFGYIISGDSPDWRPVRAFDNGRQTFIEFPASLAVGEAPPLFILGAKGEAELVNYRVRGHFYIVDRLFTAAELRLGTRHQDVVRITRRVSAPAGRRGRRAV